VERVIATENDARALACARENIARLGLAEQVNVVEADLYPEGRAPLVVCNPPWIPSQPARADRARGLRRGRPHAARVSLGPRRAP
jgi:methylase of polypeptide subunit release factors